MAKKKTSKGTRTPAFSLRQRRLICQRVLWYALNSAAPGSKRLEWPTIRDEIYAATGVHFPGDSLRQYIISKKRSANAPARRTDNPERIAALFKFVVEMDYLRPEELEPHAIFEPAALGLQLFLQGKSSPLTFESYASLKGAYRSSFNGADHAEGSLLFIDFMDAKQLVHVTEHRQYETYTVDADEYDEIYFGWAVGNVGCHVVCLRNEYGDLRLHMLLQSTPILGGKKAIQAFKTLTYSGALPGTLAVDNESGSAATVIEGQLLYQKAPVSFYFSKRNSRRK